MDSITVINVLNRLFKLGLIRSNSLMIETFHPNWVPSLMVFNELLQKVTITLASFVVITLFDSAPITASCSNPIELTNESRLYRGRNSGGILGPHPVLTVNPNTINPIRITVFDKITPLCILACYRIVPL